MSPIVPLTEDIDSGFLSATFNFEHKNTNRPLRKHSGIKTDLSLEAEGK